MTQEFDAAIVLACGINEDGTLPEDPKESVEIAAQLYESNRVPLIIFSGSLSYKATFTPPITESEAMYEYAQAIGVPTKTMLIENDSKDTLGNAYFTKLNYLMPRNLGRLAIIMGPNHSLERVQYIFDKVLGEDFATSFIEHNANRPGEPEREQRSLVILRQWLDDIPNGDHQAIYDLMRTKHPAYKS